ncbi:probable cyclic nucleotide-gated ion channel 20, chloroplastic [Arachis hypogaea]|uniref:probable cyclic nucleotide-gated ion channel 20, chloroplastic n=1 Tax=Arachis hypogaea TaxID=3818 RepID=UPI000DEC27B7|nr:probable cyclic nucleotide-gated ion channel 20, chloroplastic [Arachis hypogaea]
MKLPQGSADGTAASLKEAQTELHVMVYGVPENEVVSTILGRVNPLLFTMLMVQHAIQIVRYFPNQLFGTHETIRSVFATNVVVLVLIGHLVGCFGYLAAVEKVEKCLRTTCSASGLTGCKSLIVCEAKKNNDEDQWLINTAASNCFNSSSNTSGNGIFADLMPLVEYDPVQKYAFALFWGITQISFISVKTPSFSSVKEVIFLWIIRALGLSIFAIIFGNITSIIQGFSRRKIDNILRRNEIERWSRHRHLPEDLSRRILDAEIQNWTATKGMKEEELLKSMPKDIQRDLTRHQFLPIIKKVQLFEIMHQSILDAICMQSKWKLYLADSTIMYPGDLIEMIVFVVHGTLEIKDTSGTSVHISDGDACCQELLFWCLQRASSNSSTDGDKLFFPEERFLSTKSITCLTDVEAFVVEVTDLEKILTRFAKFLHTPLIEEAIKSYLKAGERASTEFRLAYISFEPTTVGAGYLVDHPKKIARHYMTGFRFWVDLCVLISIPLIMFYRVSPDDFNFRTSYSVAIGWVDCADCHQNIQICYKTPERLLVNFS